MILLGPHLFLNDNTWHDNASPDQPRDHASPLFNDILTLDHQTPFSRAYLVFFILLTASTA